MRKPIVMALAAGLGILLLVLFFHRQEEQMVRTHVVADYLQMTRVMSSFMIEVAVTQKASRPSAYSLQVAHEQNQAFQKKYRRYRNMRLHLHNRVGDFLASVDATTRNYIRLAQMSKTTPPAVRQQQVQALNKLFFHNAVYCALAVGRDKKTLAISRQQRNELLGILYSTYGSILYEYSKMSVKPPFLANMLIVQESLEKRRPLAQKKSPRSKKP